MARIDLHAHSTASDGGDTPAELVRAAARAGLDVVALTDHDTVAGYQEAGAALPPGLMLVPGAEISCAWQGTSVHLLGYLFDPAEPEFAAERDRIRSDRVRRAERMVELLGELGAPVRWERVAELAAGGSVGRPHVAAAMVEAGVVPDLPAAFTTEWIGATGRAYVRKYALDPVRAVQLVRAAGGVAVLAHPQPEEREYRLPDALIAELAAGGLTGVEVDHPDHSADTRAHLRGLARELGLAVTGSSDYHGDVKTTRLGENLTAVAEYERLLAAATGARPVEASRTA
ncbi:MAG: PHP domain-containing protein [Streptosporangiales bacterium]|nr:PHP domain-containing protein [Streptosporangiales bacterium]